MKILEVNNISKSYDGGKSHALQQIDFTVEKGKICAIVGKSGSGKTTMLRLIAGLERPEVGVIKINNKIVSSIDHIVAPQNRNIGMVFQDLALFPHLTVAQNIAYGMKEQHDKDIHQYLQLIGLEGYQDRYPHQLSGGEQQRVALARTLILRPELVLLDEPFSSLDGRLKSKLRLEVKNIINKLGTSMLFITHDIYDAIAIADEIIFIHNGQIIEKGEVLEVYKNAQHKIVKDIFKELKEEATFLIQKFK